jgi:hypothetical protein
MVDLRTDTREQQLLAEKHVRAVTTRLAEEFDTPAADLEVRVRDEFSRLEHARVTHFVPVFVERRVRDELRRR